MPDWNPQANDLFLQALERPSPDERRAYLDGACGADAGLRGQVEALLAAAEKAGSILEGPVVVPEATVDEAPANRVGRRVGPYKLLQQLGEGGMGTVFLAEQEQPVRRRVALKVVKPGLDSRQVLGRFEAERQALAMMDHPNIARVLDAGATPEGRPYFVMELVKGIPITKYCDQEHLTPRERLELFIPVCQAVQHAHQKGVIHRDLKPSNVLIGLYDGRPVPKVIDFGVAKATAQRLTERTMFTEVGQVVGTLEYMSPEQAELNNLDIDTRADIYSLGVLLYELLTGSPPFTAKQLRSAAFTEMLRIIRESEPPRPSTKLSSSAELPAIAAQRKLDPARLTRLVRGDLDWIVMKCLEKERARRYETANGLAMDVQRYLADEPVLAGPPGARYRLGKFLRRHRRPVLAAAVIALLLVGGIVGTSLGFLRAEQQRRQAEAAARAAQDEKARAVAAQRQAMEALQATTDDVVERLLAGKPSLGPAERAFLENVLKRWRAFAAQAGEDEQARVIRAEGAARVAFVQMRLGQREDAVAGFGEAIALLEKLAAEFPAAPHYRQNLARSYDHLGNLLGDLGRREEAEAAYRQALALFEKLAVDSPAGPDDRGNLAGCCNNLGALLQEMGKREEALAAHRQALALREKLVIDFPAVPGYRLELAQSHGNLGVLLKDLGKWAEAEAAYRRAIALEERLAEDFLAVPAYRRNAASSQNNLGLLLAGLGKGAEAEAAYRRAITLREKLAADFPAVPDYRQRLARSHSNLGILLGGVGKRAEAEAAYRQAIALQEKLIADSPGVPQYREDLAASHANLGTLLKDLGRWAEAEAAYRQAVALFEKLAADSPAVPDYLRGAGGSHANLGFLLAGTRRRAEAEAAYRQALALQERLAADFPAVPQYRQDLARSRNNLGTLLKDLARRPEAEAACRQALALQEQLAADFPAVPQYRQELAHSYANLGALFKDRAEAEAAYRQALALQERLAADFPAVPDYRRDLAAGHNNLGTLLDEVGKRAEAEAAYRRAITLCEKLAADSLAVPDYRFLLGRVQCNLGDLLRTGGRAEQALEWYVRATATLEEVLRQGPTDVTVSLSLRDAHRGRALALDALKRHAEAVAEWDRVVALAPAPERASERMLRAASRARAGQADAACRDAEELVKNADADTLYNAACVFALASMSRQTDPVPPEEREKYARRAVALLRQAVARGLKDIDQLKKDDDLAALRPRDDFRKLLAELEKKAP